MKQKKTIDIAFLISHGFTSRGLFQTDLIAKLISNGLNIAVICINKEEQLVENCKKYGVELYEYKMPYGRVQYHFDRSRKYFLEEIRKNPVLWEKHIRRTKNEEGRGLKNRIVNQIYYLIYLLFSTFPFLRKGFHKVEQSVLKDEKAYQLLKKIDPSILVATRPSDSSESFLLIAAKNLDIPKVYSIASWDNISSKGALPVLAEEYITWGPIMSKELQDYYNVTKSQITECGVPHFDIHYDIVQKNNNMTIKDYFGLDPEKPFLFFAMSAPVYSPHEIDIIKWIADRINEGYWGHDLQFVIRPHIQNVKGRIADTTWIQRLKNMKSEKVAVDFPKDNDSILSWSMHKESMKKLSHLIANSSITMSSGSTVSIEGVIADRPSIITSFDGGFKEKWWNSATRLITFPHLATAVSYDAIKIVRSYDELTTAIKNYIEHPNLDREQRQELTTAEIGYFDGKATQRFVNTYTRLIKKYRKGHSKRSTIEPLIHT